MSLGRIDTVNPGDTFPQKNTRLDTQRFVHSIASIYIFMCKVKAVMLYEKQTADKSEDLAVCLWVSAH